MINSNFSTLLSLSLATTSFIPSSTPPSHSLDVKSSYIQSERKSMRRMKYFLSPAHQLKPMGGNYVGELQEKWQFRSDHLPIGMKLNDLHILSWNVLDSDYMSWVTELNSQGLSRSLIAEEHLYIEGSGLTIREKNIVSEILIMLSGSKLPRSIMTLQECNEPFLEELQLRLPEHFAVVSSYGEATIIDLRQFHIVEAKSIKGIFSETPKRTFQEIFLRRKDSGELIRLFNIHLPGNPDHPARFEFAQYIRDTFDPSITTLAMGDMNFNEIEMSNAFKKAFDGRSPFSINSPYCTNISPYDFTSKAIDHFVVYTPQKAFIELNTPDEIMAGLKEVVSLLQGQQNIDEKQIEAVL